MRRQLPIVFIVFLVTFLIVSCSDGEPASSPFGPSSGNSLSPEQLSTLLVSHSDVITEFPSLGPGERRHLTNDVFADMLGGTVADLERQGLVDAFDISFRDPGPRPAQPSADRPTGVTAIVHLLNSTQAAEAFIGRGGVPPGDHMRGTERGEGIVGSDDLPPPPIGNQSSAVRVIYGDSSTGARRIEQSVFWRRGSLVGRVTIEATDELDHIDAAIRLGQQTDQRMMALSGN